MSPSVNPIWWDSKPVQALIASVGYRTGVRSHLFMASKRVWILYNTSALHCPAGESLLSSWDCRVSQSGLLQDQDMYWGFLMFHLGPTLGASWLKNLQNSIQSSILQNVPYHMFNFPTQSSRVLLQKTTSTFTSSLLEVKELSVYWHHKLQICY